ncbi:MAG: ABC transporter ATP-binding protein, partial [Ruminococcus sp.]|nr:ABC transporter ATP-binding protein [Ruminococcus sp.]
LDVLARRELWHFIQGLKGRMTIVLTTHYLEEAESLCDRIGIMAHGVLCAEGSVQDLKAKAGTDDFEDAFIRLAGEGLK